MKQSRQQIKCGSENATLKLDIIVATCASLFDMQCEKGILDNLDNRKRKKIFGCKRYFEGLKLYNFIFSY